MKGCVVYASYNEAQDTTYVHLAGRLENNQSFIITNVVRPYFFMKKSDLKQAAHLLAKYTVEETNLTTFAAEPVVSVSHAGYTELERLADALQKNNIDTYESDIKPHTRFMIDNGIFGTINIEGEHQSDERTDRLYQEARVTPASFTPCLKVVALDIESDKSGDNLFCIGLYTNTYKKVFMVTDKKIPNTILCKNEADCLERVKKEIIRLDPDIITGWNIASFDFPYLKQRYEKNKMQFDIGRDNSDIKMRISNNFFRGSTITIIRRQELDSLNLIKDTFIK